MNEYTVKLPRELGEQVKTPGVNFNSHVTLRYRRGAFAVLHFTGGKHWAGLYCERESHPARYHLVRIDHVKVSARDSAGGEAFERDRATVIEEVAPGHRWRAALDDLIAKADGLAGGTTP